MDETIEFDPSKLVKLAHYKMPFGKYEGRYLSDLPEAYLVWFKQNGFPKGDLGRMLMEVYEIKLNGLEYLLRKIRVQTLTADHKTIYFAVIKITILIKIQNPKNTIILISNLGFRNRSAKFS